MKMNEEVDEEKHERTRGKLPILPILFSAN